MDNREVLVSELQESREHMVALLQAKLDTMASQIKDLTSRIVGELQTVLPPDPEVLLPLASIAERIASMGAAKPAASVSLETMRKLDAGRAQSEILQELLIQLGSWAGERAIVVFREGQVSGWAGAGFATGDPARGWRGAISDSAAVQRAADGVVVTTRSEADKVLSTWLPGPRRVLVVPMSLRGKVVGALIASEAPERFDPVVIQSLTYVTGLMLESIAARATVPTPALRDPEDLVPEPSKSAARPQAHQQAAPQFAFATAEESALEVESAGVPHAVSMPAGVDAGATVHLKIPAAAVVQARSPEEERRHEEAKRFARLLVSEIRLYNEQAVQEGKQSHDIYHRLKEDVDRSQEMYEQRVPAEVRANSNYFFEELVRILADGDPDALGL